MGLNFINVLVLFLLPVASWAAPVVRDLPNNLKEVIVPFRGAEVVALALRIGVGSADEVLDSDPTKNEVGVAHEVEHLLFQGNDLFADEPSLMAELERLGIQRNAMTTYDKTVVYLIVPKNNLEAALKLLAHVVGRSDMKAEHVRNEARPVQEEIARNLTDPVRIAIEIGGAMHAQRGGRMSETLTGTVQESRARDPKVVQNFYKKHYSASNMVLSIVGGIDDLDAVRKLVDAEFGSLASFATPPRASISDLIDEKGQFEIVRVKSPAKSASRALDLKFAIPRTSENEAAAPLLSRYLNRKGHGAPFTSLMDKGWVEEDGLVIFPQVERNTIVFHVSFRITEEGDANLNELVEDVFSVLGSVKKNGLPAHALAELKQWYERTGIRGTNIVEDAMRFADDAAERPENELGQGITGPMDVSGDAVKKLAAEMKPEAVHVTVLTPNVSAPKPTATGVEAEVIAAPEVLNRARAAFENGAADVAMSENRFAYDNTPKAYRAKGLQLFYMPQPGNPGVDALFVLNLYKGMKPVERMGVFIALHAFDLERVHQRVFGDAAEAGVGVALQFDSENMNIVIRAQGPAAGTIRALNTKLALWRNYQVTPEAFERARRDVLRDLRAAKATEVGPRAFFQGRARLMGKKPNTQEVIAEIEKLDLAKVQSMFDMVKAGWSVKGVALGNWGNEFGSTTSELLKPEIPLDDAPVKRNPEFKDQLHPNLVVEQSEWNRQAVARLYPVSVTPMSPEHFAFLIFERVLKDRVMNTTRNEQGLVYAFQTGFDLLPTGGGMLYVVGDTSHKAMTLAMSFTVTLEALLMSEPMTPEEFKSAIGEVATELGAENRGARGVYNQRFEGFNPLLASMALKSLNPQKVIEIVRSQLDFSRKIDSVVAGAGDPVCQKLLLGLK